MHWLPFLRSLFPANPPARHPVPEGTPSATSTESTHQGLSPENTPSSIGYDPGLAQFIQDQFLNGVETALAARGWTKEVPEHVVTNWGVALPKFYDPLTKLTETPIRTRFSSLGPYFGELVAALDDALGIERGGTVGIDDENTLTLKMRNDEGLAPDFPQRFDAVVGVTAIGGVEPKVEVTLEAKPGSASKPAGRNGRGGGLADRTGARLAEAVVLSAAAFARVEAGVRSFVGKMIHGARFHKNRFFLYFDGITYGVGALVHAVDPPASTGSQRLRPPPPSSAPAQSSTPFSVLLTPPIPNGNGPTGRPADDHLPTDPPPPSLILVVLAALYPQLINQNMLDARMVQIVDGVRTRDAERHEPIVEREATGSGSTGSGQAPGCSSGAGAPSSSTSRTSSAHTRTVVWPDEVSAAVEPVELAQLQRRLDALQEPTVEHASSDEDSPPSLVASSARSITPPPHGPFTPPVSPEQLSHRARDSGRLPLASTESEKVAPRASPAALEPIKLEKLINYSERSFVYRGTFGVQRVIAKVGRRDWEDVIINEAAASILAYQRKAAVPKLLGLFEGRDPVDERRIVVAVYPDCGDAPRSWTDLPMPQRIELLLDLVYLHQRAHLEHGDAAPRNTLVDANGKTRWIDLSGARAHESCDGADCWELSEVCSEMELWDEEEVVREASKRGLRW